MRSRGVICESATLRWRCGLHWGGGAIIFLNCREQAPKYGADHLDELSDVEVTPRIWYLSDERLKELHAQVGVNQLIFGLDFPYNLETETKIGLETVRRLFDEKDQALILGGNLRREVGLPDL